MSSGLSVDTLRLHSITSRRVPKQFLRCEADYYGASYWLAEHLGLEFYPLSSRGFQHGWIHISCEEFKPWVRTLNIPSGGILVQDEDFAQGLKELGYYAVSTGLPFKVFLDHSDIKDVFSRSSEKALFVPTHSAQFNANYSDIVLRQISEAANVLDNFAVLLAASDIGIIDEVRKFTPSIEIGASIEDINSFMRLARIFLTYPKMITSAWGSHIAYGHYCNMEVRFLLTSDTRREERGVDLLSREKHKIRSWSSSEFFSPGILRLRYPALFDNTSSSVLNIPSPSTPEPSEIAKHLGWSI